MQQFDRLRIGLTVTATLAIWSLLVWQHFHGGVAAHHLLHDPDLPRISDWYGGLLLPVLTWFLLSLTRCRIKAEESPGHMPGLMPVIVGLMAGLAYGLAMAITFLSGNESVTSYLFFGLLPLALLLPVYRPECLLGFVLGMSTAFGVVLPTLFGLLMMLATFVIHRFIGQPLRAMVGLRKGTELRGFK